MRSVLRYLVLSFLLLSLTPRPLHSETRGYVAGGVSVPSQSSAAFTGRSGWGLGVGLEHGVAKPASFVFEMGYTEVPAYQPGVTFAPDGVDLSAFQIHGPAVRTISLWGGLRMHGSGSGPRGYFDLLTGVSNLYHGGAFVDASGGRGFGRNEINGALSVGAGFASPPLGRTSLFADAHYQFFFSGAGAPLVPIRVGLISR